MKIKPSHFVIVFFLLVACTNQQKVESQKDRSMAFDGTSASFVDDPDEGVFLGEHAPIVCNLRFTSKKCFNIRTGPNINDPVCGSPAVDKENEYAEKSMCRTTNGKPTVISLPESRYEHTRWVRVGKPRADHCPNQQGFVHISAFNSKDQLMYRNGLCGRFINEVPSRAKTRPHPEPAPTSTTVKTKGYNYTFPLPACWGLKNKGGKGHFWAERCKKRNRKGRCILGFRRHKGVDYYAPWGTKLRAPCTGTVERAGLISGYGYTVAIRCDDPPKHLIMLAHMKKMYVKRKARVTAGTHVGEVGNTGNAWNWIGGRKVYQAPQVHVEIRKGNTRQVINPSHIWDCSGDSGH